MRSKENKDRRCIYLDEDQKYLSLKQLRSLKTFRPKYVVASKKLDRLNVSKKNMK